MAARSKPTAVPATALSTAWKRVSALSARLDWFRGLRVATATCTPMLLGASLHQPLLAWTALGGFEAVLADRGGPYRRRIAMLGTLTLGGAAGLLAGTLAGVQLTSAIPVAILWCFAWTYLTTLGPPFTSASILVNVIFLCGIGSPSPDPRIALLHAGYLLLGGLWAMALSLFLWPVDPYRPVRFAIASCYRQLAVFLLEIQQLSQNSHPLEARSAAWHRSAQLQQSLLRRLLEEARDSLAATSPATISAQQLVVLLETADYLLSRTIALAEQVEQVDPSAAHSASSSLHPAVNLAPSLPWHSLAATELWVAETLEQRQPSLRNRRPSAGPSRPPSRPGTRIETRQKERLAVLSSSATSLAAPRLDPGIRHTFNGILSAIEVAVNYAALVRGSTIGEKTPGPSAGSESAPGGLRPRLQQQLAALREPLLQNWTRNSLLFRHAARVALVVGVDIFVSSRFHTAHFHFTHGYWITLTSLIVLQPHVAGTMRKSLDRTGGTILGGILAAVLAVTLRSQAAIALILFPLAGLALATMPVSYVLFSIFLTPTFVLVSLPHAGDWHLAIDRMLNTALGAAFAMIAMRLLWPVWEQKRFPGMLAASVAADRLYLERLIELLESRFPGAGSKSYLRSLALARRNAGLAHNNSEESLERLLLEPAWRLPGRSQPATAPNTAPNSAPETAEAVALVTYLRRIAQSITTLATLALPHGSEITPSGFASVLTGGRSASAVQRETQSVPALSKTMLARLHAMRDNLQRLETHIQARLSGHIESTFQPRPAPAEISGPALETPENQSTATAHGEDATTQPITRQVLRLERQLNVIDRRLSNLLQSNLWHPHA